MLKPVTTDAPRIYPELRYRDPAAMVRWLQAAFGFSVYVDFRDDDGDFVHAELAYGSSLVMLSHASDSEYDSLMAKPGTSSRPTVGLYIAVDDPDAHHAGAVAAGAEIVMALTDQPYGSREYSARDPEGYVWSFGTYYPKVGEPPLVG